MEQVARTIKRLQSLKQSPDELAIDMDAVYEAQNLLNEAIEVLYARTKVGSQNPAIYRLLGDRFLEVKSPDAAMTAYKSAIALAQKVNNLSELALAQVGARIALKAQSYNNSLKQRKRF